VGNKRKVDAVSAEEKPVESSDLWTEFEVAMKSDNGAFIGI
jgi:hypothetical protein